MNSIAESSNYISSDRNSDISCESPLFQKPDMQNKNFTSIKPIDTQSNAPSLTMQKTNSVKDRGWIH